MQQQFGHHPQQQGRGAPGYPNPQQQPPTAQQQQPMGPGGGQHPQQGYGQQPQQVHGGGFGSGQQAGPYGAAGNIGQRRPQQYGGGAPGSGTPAGVYMPPAAGSTPLQHQPRPSPPGPSMGRGNNRLSSGSSGMTGGISISSLADLKRIASDPEMLKRILLQNKVAFLIWGLLFVFVLFIYHVVSDKDFSFLLTLGAMLRTVAFLVLLFKVVSQRSGKGISLKTLQCYVCVFVFRLCSILFYEGYLPYDSSGDWFYQVVEIISLGLVVFTGAFIYLLYRPTYQEEYDYFGNYLVPTKFGAVWIIGVCFLFALVFHPTLNSNFITDTCWCWALFIECVAIVPQLFLLHRSKSEVEQLTGHFVALLFFARLMQLIFWLSSYDELREKMLIGGAHVGHIVVLSQIIQLVLMCDYIYYYVIALITNAPVRLPTSRVSTNV